MINLIIKSLEKLHDKSYSKNYDIISLTLIDSSILMIPISDSFITIGDSKNVHIC